MNERIKELMTQAGFDPASIERMGVMPNAEKFAELLVNECVTACEKNSWITLNAFQRSKQIKQHFGIK